MKKIKIYTKDYCPYCDKAKLLLNELGATYEEIDITHKPKVMHELVQKSSLMTVPQIFVEDENGEKCLGGCDDIYKLHEEGKLLKELGLG